MASPSTLVGDNSSCFLHDRFPVRVGHVGYEHITFLEVIKRLTIGLTLKLFDNLYFADSDFFAYSDSLYQWRPRGSVGQLELSNSPMVLSAMHGFWACLDNIESILLSVYSPLSIYWAPTSILARVMILDSVHPIR